ncbi:MAG: NifU family protein [Planctomycetes bacterium]|nr:NifU family protein [Planctomycetota bacterium]NUQ35889.1 NifU family protein [Planctomycetaceae bacterium]
MTSPRHQETLRALDVVRPYVQGDGGDIELVDVGEDGVVSIRLVGNCVGCGAANHTIHDVIEDFLRSQLPWVTGVHAEEEAEAGSQGSRSLSKGTTADLEALQRAVDARIERLNKDLAGIALGAPLPENFERSVQECRAEFRLLHDMEEQCLYPVIEMFVTSLAGQLPSLRELRARIDIAFDVFERAIHGAHDAPSQTSLDQVRVALAQTAELIDEDFTRKRDALYEMVDASLPDELKQELRSDISQFRRRNIVMYQRQ